MAHVKNRHKKALVAEILKLPDMVTYQYNSGMVIFLVDA